MAGINNEENRIKLLTLLYILASHRCGSSNVVDPIFPFPLNIINGSTMVLPIN